MATTYQPNLAFDTLGFSEALINRGYDQEQAKALAVVVRDYVISGLATNISVQAAIQEAKVEIKQEITEVKHELEKALVQLDNKIERENALLEKRMTMTMGKMLAFFTGILLAGIPIIQAVISKLG